MRRLKNFQGNASFPYVVGKTFLLLILLLCFTGFFSPHAHAQIKTPQDFNNCSVSQPCIHNGTAIIDSNGCESTIDAPCVSINYVFLGNGTATVTFQMLYSQYDPLVANTRYSFADVWLSDPSSSNEYVIKNFGLIYQTNLSANQELDIYMRDCGLLIDGESRCTEFSRWIFISTGYALPWY